MARGARAARSPIEPCRGPNPSAKLARDALNAPFAGGRARTLRLAFHRQTNPSRGLASVSPVGANMLPCLRTSLALLVTMMSCAPALVLQVHDDRYEACGRRSGADAFAEQTETVVGTIQQIVDGTELDGPVKMVAIDPSGRPRRLFFESLFTKPSPSPQRQATYRRIAPTRVGDCVRAGGRMMDNGSLWIDQFVNIDRPALNRP